MWIRRKRARGDRFGKCVELGLPVNAGARVVTLKKMATYFLLAMQRHPTLLVAALAKSEIKPWHAALLVFLAIPAGTRFVSANLLIAG
jgi:hypothetical protein